MILLCLLVANSKIRDNAEYVHNVERESCFKTSTGDRKQGESFDIFQVPHGNELWRRELGGNSLALLWW